MKIFNGEIGDFHSDDQCKSCIFIKTCAKLDVLKEESKQNNDLGYTKLIIYECPNREIPK